MAVETERREDPLEERKDPLELFPVEVREPIRGLTLLGALQEEVVFCGHHFVLRTLRPHETAAIGIAVHPWRGTIKEAEVYGNAHVGMALVAVDNDDGFCPQAGTTIEQFARGRLNYVSENWYQPTLDYLYTIYLNLEAQAARATQAWLNLYSRGRTPISQPFADSSTVPGGSNSPTDGASPLLIPSS